MKTVSVAMAGLALLTVGAWAQETGAPAETPVAAPATPASAKPAEPPQKEKKICRRAPETGSFIASRTCRTKAEWAEIDAARKGTAESFLEEVNDRPDKLTAPH